MDKLNKVEDLAVDVHFQCTKENQNYLIEFILAFSQLNPTELAALLDVSALMLDQSRTGRAHLPHEAAKKLADLFGMLFNN